MKDFIVWVVIVKSTEERSAKLVTCAWLINSIDLMELFSNISKESIKYFYVNKQIEN